MNAAQVQDIATVVLALVSAIFGGKAGADALKRRRIMRDTGVSVNDADPYVVEKIKQELRPVMKAEAKAEVRKEDMVQSIYTNTNLLAEASARSAVAEQQSVAAQQQAAAALQAIAESTSATRQLAVEQQKQWVVVSDHLDNDQKFQGGVAAAMREDNKIKLEQGFVLREMQNSMREQTRLLQQLLYERDEEVGRRRRTLPPQPPPDDGG